MSDQKAVKNSIIDGEHSSDDYTGFEQQPLILESSYQERIKLLTKKNTSGLLLIEQ